jgi:hypothetical protein
MIRWADTNRLLIRDALITAEMMQVESNWDCIETCSAELSVLGDVCAIPKLCERMSSINIPTHAISDDNPPDPSTAFRNVRQLSTCSANCAEGWMLTLLDSNTASLERITIGDGDDYEEEDLVLPENWLLKFLGRCSKLIDLKIAMPVSYGRMLHDIAASCPELRQLCVECPQDDWEQANEDLSTGAVLLAKSCVHLTKLDLECATLSQAAIREVLLHGKNITEMQICGANFSAADLLLLMSPARKSLPTVLEMTWSLAQESDVLACADLFRALQSLAVTVLPQRAHTFLAAVPYLGALRSLDFDLDDVSDEEGLAVCLAVAERCQGLTKLFMTHEFTPGTMRGVEALLAGNRHLSTIEIICAEGADEMLALIGARCPLLTHLIADTCDATDVGISAVARGCKHLTFFQVKGGQYTRASLLEVQRNCRHLVECGLPCDMLAEDADIAEFVKSCRALDTLTVRMCVMAQDNILMDIAPRTVTFYEGYGEF